MVVEDVKKPALRFILKQMKVEINPLFDILKDKNGKYKMHVCDQRGLCLDMCPVGALTP